MLAPHLVEINELTPHRLCNYIETKYYSIIQQQLNMLTEYIDELQGPLSANDQIHLIAVLYYRLKDEVAQLIRNDSLIIFPLIRNDAVQRPCVSRKLPVAMIQSMHKKIMHLMDKIRQMLNNYIVRPEWSQEFKIFCEEMIGLEQFVQQVIYLKENVLLPKVELSFNQICQGNCKHA